MEASEEFWEDAGLIEAFRGRAATRKWGVWRGAKGGPGPGAKKGRSFICRIGALNTQCLGALTSKHDQEAKWRCFLGLAEARGWDALGLSDVRLGGSGYIEKAGHDGDWLVVHSGKVAVALAPKVAANWKRKGGKWEGSIDGRSIRIDVPGTAGRSAWSVVSVYAPDSKAPKAWRQNFFKGIQQLRNNTPKSAALVIGGDWNAQIGMKKGEHETCFGKEGRGSRTKTGATLVDFALEQGLVFPHSWFQQKDINTWVSPAGVGFAIDYFLVPKEQLCRVARVRVIHDCAAVSWDLDPWRTYTDHRPIETVIKVKHKFRQAHPVAAAQPAWEKLRGQSKRAMELRVQFQKLVDSLLERNGPEDNPGWSVVCEALHEGGLRVLGKREPRKHQPWMAGKEDELKRLGLEIQEKRRAYKESARSIRPWTEQDALGVQEKRKVWRAADKVRRKTVKGWETEWWEVIADRLEEAEGARNIAETFKIHREMTTQACAKRRKTKPLTKGSVEAEREAWKLHFERVSADPGKVAEVVWKHIPAKKSIETWLGEEPTLQEFNEALRKMPLGKAAGVDKLHVEAIKYSSQKVLLYVFEFAQDMWRKAVASVKGREAAEWPEAWKQAMVIPLWKGKGAREDKNSWRGVTLLSVGTKLLARVVADRSQRWSENFVAKNQTGFRKGKGTDDAHQITRMLAEEAAQAGEEGVVMSFYDIEKAYPRVCREALWEVLSRFGACPRFVAVCRGLHEHTSITIKVLGGLSKEYVMKRGLREGCPSSPPLFNIYHHAVMEDFRGRRAQNAAKNKLTPGVPWSVKVIGEIAGKNERPGTLHTEQLVLGDVEYADDTTIFALAPEFKAADEILKKTMTDWEERANDAKQEILHFPPTGIVHQQPFRENEVETVKHVGAWISVRATQTKETSNRIQKTQSKIRDLQRVWKRGRNGKCRWADRSSRVRIVKAVVGSSLLVFCKTRPWSKGSLQKLQAVQNRSIKLAVGVTWEQMRRYSFTCQQLLDAAGWSNVQDSTQRQTLSWLGHVARMQTNDVAKIGMFGQLDISKKPNKNMKQKAWLRKTLEEAKIPLMDWFRMAQAKGGGGIWQWLIDRAFPKPVFDAEAQKRLRDWKLHEDVPVRSTKKLRVHPDAPPGVIYFKGHGRDRPPELAEGRGPWKDKWCPVCGYEWQPLVSTALWEHYRNEHAVTDASRTTYKGSMCASCLKWVPHTRLKHRAGFQGRTVANHRCCKSLIQNQVAKAVTRNKGEVQSLPAELVPKKWFIFTDGSGDTVANSANSIAGWGAALFRNVPNQEEMAVVELFGPVVTDRKHHLFQGADRATVNSGEATAMLETILWLLQECPKGWEEVEIFYDSEVAGGAATRRYLWTSHADLAERLAQAASVLSKNARATWTKVKGHSGLWGNEEADRLAGLGKQGMISDWLGRWNQVAKRTLGATTDDRSKAAAWWLQVKKHNFTNSFKSYTDSHPGKMQAPIGTGLRQYFNTKTAGSERGSRDNQTRERQKRQDLDPGYFQALEESMLEAARETSRNEALQKSVQDGGGTLIKVLGDGNCLFRAISVSLTGQADCHKEIRQEVCKRALMASAWQRCGNQAEVEAAVFAGTMKKDGEWGDITAIQLAAEAYQARITVFQPFSEPLTFGPEVAERQIRIAWNGRTHFDAVGVA
jgi:ribonuclease HI